MSPTYARRRVLGSIGAVVGAASLAGCSSVDGDGNGGGTAEGSAVEMTGDLVFDPDEITVTVGETVVWENVGNVGHTVTAYEDEIPGDAAYFASGGFDSEQAARDAYTSGREGEIPGGESFEHTFETPGTYEYFCIPHESSMVGTVQVEEG